MDCIRLEGNHPIILQQHCHNKTNIFVVYLIVEGVAKLMETGVHKKPQKFIFEYWVFSQESYLNVGCFKKIHICIPKIRYLHTS